MNTEKMIQIVKARQELSKALARADEKTDRDLKILWDPWYAIVAVERLYPALKAQALEALEDDDNSPR